ncbi:hypothetical protein CIRMBP1231_00021 [Enterococcus cecorum]|uniref:Uncharacterized protein n=1 Tax=Enterococcus cecorum TaxID=44008 RepID=A0A1Y4QWY3_9ENTE|nr:hypothetical protein [Enterococcus cecorum]OUQ09807.1 hypothetical protein B5E88_08570 [Enterococcus cecorum]CAI3251463.1 hypothetical protein CIRMBP1259_00021 [Enterococcus cecorum]CAI3252072.1 hypothetical protein CIRMBP1231_00021 [Enterococcus cecorum]CAI3270057.1 hypothetical protein CIRMBP1258_00226 [Enterococcus cecorum]CAI3291275.1 hypothetical protein CIRMBP1246_00583 [Enterococcus cecorum]
MRKKLILSSLLFVTFIFSLQTSWAYLIDSKEYKTAFSGQVAYNNGLSYSINGTTNNQLNVNFNDGKNTPVRTYQLTIKNNTSYQLDPETIKFETNPIMIQNYQIVLSRAKITDNENEFVCDLSISLVNTQSTTENFTLPKVVAYSVGNKKIESIKDYQVTIIPQNQGIYNDVQQDLGDLGIPGYFHIFAKNQITYNTRNSSGNLATKNLMYNGKLDSLKLINYVSDSAQLNGTVANFSKFVIGNTTQGNIVNNTYITKQDNYLDFDKEMQKANEVSHTILNYPDKHSPEVIRGLFWRPIELNIDTSKVSSSSNVLVYHINYDGNNLLPITINNSQKKFIIINLNVENTTSVKLPPTDINADDCPYVLWNINRKDNQPMAITRDEPSTNYGTILAPNANLTINSNTYGAGFYGNFIGQSFTTNVLTKRVAMRTFDLETGTFK